MRPSTKWDKNMDQNDVVMVIYNEGFKGIGLTG